VALFQPWMLPLPFKLNQSGRHHIPRQKRKVTNWPAYDASLRQRGSLTVWFTDEAVEAWKAEPRTTRGGQPHLYGAFDVKLLPSSTSMSRSFFLEGCGELLSRDRHRWPPHVRWYGLWTGCGSS